MIKKNCYNCKHLEFVTDDSEATNNSGWSCAKRNYEYLFRESKHLAFLQTEKYRLKSKSCCDIKDIE